VPNRAPNNLWPRLRSSSWPLWRLAARLSLSTGDSRASVAVPSVLTRGLLASFSDTEDCLRLRDCTGDADLGARVVSRGSGTRMADVRVLSL
jgi:hypothetical protein